MKKTRIALLILLSICSSVCFGYEGRPQSVISIVDDGKLKKLTFKSWAVAPLFWDKTHTARESIESIIENELNCRNTQIEYKREFGFVGVGGCDCGEPIRIIVRVTYAGLLGWSDINLNISAFKGESAEEIFSKKHIID